MWASRRVQFCFLSQRRQISQAWRGVRRRERRARRAWGSKSKRRRCPLSRIVFAWRAANAQTLQSASLRQGEALPPPSVLDTCAGSTACYGSLLAQIPCESRWLAQCGVREMYHAFLWSVHSFLCTLCLAISCLFRHVRSMFHQAAWRGFDSYGVSSSLLGICHGPQLVHANGSILYHCTR